MVLAGDTGVDGSCLHPINPVVTATAAKILIKIFFTFFLLWVPWNVERQFLDYHQMGFQFYWANSDFLVDCGMADLLVFQILNVELHFPSDHQMGFQFYLANSDFLVDCWVAELLVFQIFFHQYLLVIFLRPKKAKICFSLKSPFKFLYLLYTQYLVIVNTKFSQ